MAVLEIAKIPDKILRLKAKPVKTFDKSLQKLIDDMFDTLRSTQGVGLAAPQIRKLLRLIVVEYTHYEITHSYVLINPEIIKASQETSIEMEGCLSIPNVAGNVERSNSITIKAMNRYGEPIKIDAKDFLARIYQHEIDHLNGILYIDKAIDLYRNSDLLL